MYNPGTIAITRILIHTPLAFRKDWLPSRDVGPAECVPDVEQVCHSGMAKIREVVRKHCRRHPASHRNSIRIADVRRVYGIEMDAEHTAFRSKEFGELPRI